MKFKVGVFYKIIILNFILNLSFISIGQATVIQILHSNDSHSFLDNTTHRDNEGGVARLKALMDYYKSTMALSGIQTLSLDAGDFSEGNIYYFAENAKKSFIAENSLLFDVVTLGNHDYLMGMKDLNSLLGELDLNFSFLAANINYYNYAKDCENIKKVLKPYVELELSGIKIGILGLTANDLYYKWRFQCGKITKPIASGLRYEKVLKERGNELVIALTHIGYERDIKLAKKSHEIDLIFGGHSHIALSKPTIIKNKDDRGVAIFQAGFHTKYLGRLIVEVTKNKSVKLLSYELIPVNNLNQDKEISNLVEEAKADVDEIFGRDWLNFKIALSELIPEDSQGVIKWGNYITDTMRLKTNTDISVHSPLMNSENFPVGQITRRTLINSFPRVLDLNDQKGWSIYTTKIRGVWLQMALQSLVEMEEPLIFSGITLEYIKTPFGRIIKKVLVNGRRINPFKNYTVALTEGVVKGAEGIGKITKALLGFPKKSPYRIWSTLEERLILGKSSAPLEYHAFIP